MGARRVHVSEDLILSVLNGGTSCARPLSGQPRIRKLLGVGIAPGGRCYIDVDADDGQPLEPGEEPKELSVLFTTLGTNQ